MALQFTSVEEPSFSRGIDARSAENQIREGFVRDLVNGDIVEGRIKKRKGYESFAGNVPIRVVRYQQPGENKAIVSLDSSIDLSRVDGRPILLYGRSTTGSGSPFSSTVDKALWFTNWETNLRKYFLVNPSATPLTITASPVEHSIPTTNMYIGVSENTNADEDLLSGELLLTSMQVGSDRTITVSYNNNTANPVPVFLYYLDRQYEEGTTYVSPEWTTDAPTDDLDISSATHQLSTANIIYQLYQKVGTDWILSKPDGFYTKADGSVRVRVTADVGTIFKVILSAVPDSQSEEGENNHVLTNRPNSYLFYNCYATIDSADTLYGEGYRSSEIMPETVVYNDVLKTATFAFDPQTALSNIKFNYEQGIIRTNEIYLTGPSVGYFPTIATADSAPQMTLYGLS